MTEDEVMKTIARSLHNLAPNLFASYDVDDIFQEAFIIGIEGIDKYDEKNALCQTSCSPTSQIA